ncbi:phage tail tube protein [Comamonas kerstersii]|uniref:phage tail tube protein n=1 Tax=Comamonas kerstersii TaxID=225992 RepID=UPI001B3399EE|nr:phage tail tube protein [Comamonas kerstersii]QTW18186.1 phage tail protein [Comamonas kerstersii]
MAQRIFWSNVGVDVQTALAPAITITAISKDSPAVVTYSGTTHPANGDYISMSAQGMHQVNDRLFRIANVNSTAKTFELEGEDSTSYDTFTTGSFQVITFGASFSSVQNIQVSGGDYEKADLTTIHDAVKKEAPTVASAMQVSMTNFFDLTDPGFVECNKAFKSKTTRAIRLRFGTGAKVLFVGYVGAAGVPTGQAQQAVTTTVTIDAQNLPTTYAS